MVTNNAQTHQNLSVRQNYFYSWAEASIWTTIKKPLVIAIRIAAQRLFGKLFREQAGCSLSDFVSLRHNYSLAYFYSAVKIGRTFVGSILQLRCPITKTEKHLPDSVMHRCAL
jgi:hypothetical protein